MLSAVRQLDYAIVLCEDLDRMKAFYRDLVDFTIASESATGLTFQAGAVKLSLHQRTRGYDRQGTRSELPGVQLAFLVAPDEVVRCYEQLVAEGVEILEPPTDQPRGHRTVYFADPEGNMLEICPGSDLGILQNHPDPHIEVALPMLRVAAAKAHRRLGSFQFSDRVRHTVVHRLQRGMPPVVDIHLQIGRPERQTIHPRLGQIKGTSHRRY